MKTSCAVWLVALAVGVAGVLVAASAMLRPSMPRAYEKTRVGSDLKTYAQAFPFDVLVSEGPTSAETFRKRLSQASNLSALSGWLAFPDKNDRAKPPLELEVRGGRIFDKSGSNMKSFPKALILAKAGDDVMRLMAIIPKDVPFTFQEDSPPKRLDLRTAKDLPLSFSGDLVATDTEDGFMMDYSLTFSFTFRAGRLVDKNFERVALAGSS